MKKKTFEMNKAKQLRAKGYSIKEISRLVDASAGSVSTWVRDVDISYEHVAALAKKPHSREAIKKRAVSRKRTEKAKRDTIEKAARDMVGKLSNRELWLIGTMLYWAEGGKTQRMVRFSNGDPEMIKIMIRYFTEICEVHHEKLRGYIHIHEHLDVKQAEAYWQKTSGIPASQFYKTYRKEKTQSKRRTLPYGVMDIYILDVKLFLKIRGWTDGISDRILYHKLH